MEKGEKKIIGRFDRVDLPDIGLFNIQAKIDTGAYTSSLHCQYVRESDGQLEFVVLDEEHPEFTGMKFVFQDFTQKNIRNSFGIMERRYVIESTVTIFGEEIQTKFSLSDRDNLRFPILLGRKILRKRFVVDVMKKNLSFKAKEKKNKSVS